MLDSHPKAKYPTQYEQICPCQMWVAMDACRGFSAKVLATTTNTSAANDELQSIHLVSVDAPEEEMVFFEAVGQAFLQSYTIPRCEQLRWALTEFISENLYGGSWTRSGYTSSRRHCRTASSWSSRARTTSSRSTTS